MSSRKRSRNTWGQGTVGLALHFLLGASKAQHCPTFRAAPAFSAAPWHWTPRPKVGQCLHNGAGEGVGGLLLLIGALATLSGHWEPSGSQLG